MHSIRTDIDPSIDFLSGRELDLERDVMWNAEIFVAVDEGFIEIEDQGVLDYIRE